MQYLAIARKWRPKTFDDLVGQEHVVQTLKNAIQHDRVVHAYLFSGARGVGKTSVARIFAKALRCPQGENPQEVQAIEEGRSVDVIEIDGASNNGVEAVRSIRENVMYGAATGVYKIYIIDEVHMLSLSAFNALLKTLEEPPKHVIFIMATTELQKIPMTILSRCQRFEFRRLTHAQILKRLQEILKEEKINLSAEALHPIASHADGSLRDALSLLDQVISYFGEKMDGPLTEADVSLALGLSPSNSVIDFIRYIVHKDTDKLVLHLKEIYQVGNDLKHFSERALEELRRIYLLTLAKEEKFKLSPEELDIASSHLKELEEISSALSVLRVERMSQILNKTIQQMNWSALPLFVLEMAAIRMSQLENLEKLESQEQIETTSFQSFPSAVSPSMSGSSPASSLATASPRISTKPSSPPANRETFSPRPSSVPPSPVPQSWEGLVTQITRKRPLLGALLSHANFKLDNKNGKKHVHLAFLEDSFYEKQAKDNFANISAEIQGFYGAGTELSISNAMDTTEKSIETKRIEEEEELKTTALNHPAVKKLQEGLGADVVGVSLEQ